jgi:Protein of unknown function (DUF1580)
VNSLSERCPAGSDFPQGLLATVTVELVMIDIWTENIRTYSDASKLLPGRPHCATIARWASKGRNGVKLETVVIGGRRFTSLEAVERLSPA